MPYRLPHLHVNLPSVLINLELRPRTDRTLIITLLQVDKARSFDIAPHGVDVVEWAAGLCTALDTQRTEVGEDRVFWHAAIVT